jgi:polyhydroxyalkanoate synthesis repressor PhaR
MPNPKAPTVIKKYANRRLYSTGACAYVALEDLVGMVRQGEGFVVYDAGSGEDITRSILMLITPTTEH